MRFVGVNGENLLVGVDVVLVRVLGNVLFTSMFFLLLHYTFLFAIFNSCVNVITCFVGEQALQTM